MTLISSLSVIYYYTDIIVVGFFLGSEASGIYRVPVLIAAFIGFPMMALVSVVTPRLVALTADNDRDGFVLLVRRTARALFVTTAALSAIAIVFGALRRRRYRFLLTGGQIKAESSGSGARQRTVPPVTGTAASASGRARWGSRP